MAHPYFRFIGTVIALAGSLTVFLVGMVFADLWVSSRRTKRILKEQKARMSEQGDNLSKEEFGEDDVARLDPFKESFEEGD